MPATLSPCPQCRAFNWFWSTAARHYRQAGTELWEPVWCGDCETRLYAVTETLTGKFLRFEPRS